jgi:hypothetical protein
MKSLKIALFALSMLLCSGVTFAQAFATGKIATLYSEKGGNWVRITLDTTTINPGGCGGGDFYIVEFTSPTARGPMLAALYLAFAQRSSISMWISGCTTGTYWNTTRPSVADLYLTAP